jgi:hypothetical protein
MCVGNHKATLLLQFRGIQMKFVLDLSSGSTSSDLVGSDAWIVTGVTICISLDAEFHGEYTGERVGSIRQSSASQSEIH